MQIGSYVRSTLRKSWIVLLVTLLAAGGAFLAVRGTKDSYEGSVNVTVPMGQSGTAGANGQYVANFTVALATPSVIARVAATTGEQKADLTAGLAASQLGNSSVIQVTYSAAHATNAERVVAIAAEQTANLLAQPGIDAATTTLNAAKDARAVAASQQQVAQAALGADTATHGLVDPSLLYQSTQSSITQLNVSKQQAISQAKPTGSFDAAIRADQARLSSLAPQVVVYNSLSRSLSQAELAVQTAQSRVITASAAIVDATAAPLIGTPLATLVPRTSPIVQVVSIAGGLGFILSLALLLFLGFLAATRPPQLTT